MSASKSDDTSKQPATIRQRIFAAVIAGLISASIILGLIVWLIGWDFSPGVFVFAFFVGAVFSLLHGFSTKRTGAAAGVLGALMLIAEGFGMAVSMIAAGIAAVLSGIG